MPDMPRPTVTTTPEFKNDGKQHINIVVARDNKAKSYAGSGSTQTEAISDAVGKILDDGATAEWLP